MAYCSIVNIVQNYKKLHNYAIPKCWYFFLKTEDGLLSSYCLGLCVQGIDEHAAGGEYIFAT